MTLHSALPFDYHGVEEVVKFLGIFLSHGEEVLCAHFPNGVVITNIVHLRVHSNFFTVMLCMAEGEEE